jgi:hypothetical protein
MPGSSTTPGRSDLAMVRLKRAAFRTRNGGRGPITATAIWTASLYNRALSATEVKQLYNAGG